MSLSGIPCSAEKHSMHQYSVAAVERTGRYVTCGSDGATVLWVQNMGSVTWVPTGDVEDVCRTSAATILSSPHGRLRRAQRAIEKRDLQVRSCET